MFSLTSLISNLLLMIQRALAPLAKNIPHARFDMEQLSLLPDRTHGSDLSAVDATSIDGSPSQPSTGFVAWPKIGGSDLKPVPSGLFLERAFHDRYQPGALRTLYVAGCPGLGSLALTAKLTLQKVSSCEGDRLVARLKEINRDRYGAGYRSGDVEVFEPQGWNRWSAQVLNPERGPSPGSPVTVHARGICVRLPKTLSPEAFDKAYDAEIRKGAIDAWIRTEHGRRLCARHKLDPARFERLTQYGYDMKPRVSRALEIAVFRKDREVDRLIDIAENIIARHLHLLP